MSDKRYLPFFVLKIVQQN